MSNALATITPFRDLFEQAQTLVKSGFLPRDVNTAEKAVAIMTMGQEVGIGMWAAFNGISVIQQKPTMGPQLMLGLINRSGQLEDMTIDATDERAVVMMKRKGRAAHTETFGRKEATAMGLMGKDNYKKQPAVMMKWRAVSACARVVFPDVIMGFYLPEEINPNVVIDESGEWDRQSYYEPERQQQPQLTGGYTDYEDEPPAPSDEAQDAPQGDPPNDLEKHLGKRVIRPYSPEQLRQRMSELVDAKMNVAQAGDELDQSNIIHIANTFKRLGSNDDERHAFTLAMFGVESMKDMIKAQCWAITEWSKDLPSAKQELADVLASDLAAAA
jgi:hypothetical protein